MVGLTGPWALVLAPLLLVFWWIRKEPWSLGMAALLILCATFQAWELIGHASDRQQIIPLGATIELLCRLVAGQIYVGALWGQNSLDLRGAVVLNMVFFAAGTVLLLWGFFKLRLEMKLMIAFAMVVLAAALCTPLITGPGTQWQLLAIDKGARYWFFPMLAFLSTLLWAASQNQQRTLRLLSLACFAIMLRALVHDWRYQAYKDFDFGGYVRVFEEAPLRTRVSIPVYPIGRLMVLVKR